MSTRFGESARDPVLGRVRLLLSVAASRGDGLTLRETLDLLPEDAPTTTEELRRWFEGYPDPIRILGDVLASPQVMTEMVQRPERSRRAATFLESATALLDHPFAPFRSLALVVAVTGSVAYRSPRVGDDLDLLVVVKRGSLGLFLLWSYLSLRVERLRRGGAPPPPPVCMNLVLDVSQAERLFSAPLGLLIAREALTAVVVKGPEEYQSLLRKAGWMRELLPRLYRRVVEERTPRKSARPAPRAPLPVQVVSALVFLPLGAYLHLVGLWRNHYLRAQRGEEGTFRTLITPGRLQITSAAFDRLRETYDSGSGKGP